MKMRILILAALMLVSLTAFAQDYAIGNTVAPTLTVSVNVQSAVKLVLSTGTVGTPCAIAGGGNATYTMSFGNVNALGAGAVTCGAVTQPAIAGTDPAFYVTSYRLTPYYVHFGSGSADVNAHVSTAFADAALGLLAGSSAVPASMTAISNNVATGTPIVVNGASGTPVESYLGLSVGPAAAAGADSAVITYTMTVS